MRMLHGRGMRVLRVQRLDRVIDDYVGAYQENGTTLIAAVMGCRRRNMAWTDLKRLFAYGMTEFEKAD